MGISDDVYNKYKGVQISVVKGGRNSNEPKIWSFPVGLKFSAPCTAIYLEPSTRVLHVHLVHVIYGITSTVVYPLNLAPEGTFESMEKQLVVLNLVLLRNYQIY